MTSRSSDGAHKHFCASASIMTSAQDLSLNERPTGCKGCLSAALAFCEMPRSVYCGSDNCQQGIKAYNPVVGRVCLCVCFE